MLTEICAEIKNYFAYRKDRHVGKFTIAEGVIAGIEFPTDYFAIFGSRHNNGVHQLSKPDLVDEEFEGAVWIMSPPAAFLALAEEIATWQQANGAADSPALSPFYSESFGGYSYTKSAGSTSSAGNSAAASWQAAYADRLKLYRKVRL